MPPMGPIRTRRSVVSLLAIFALLMCQAAWAAHTPSRHFAAGGVAAAGCHSTGDTDAPQTAALSPCESAQAPSDAFKLPPVVLAALPSTAAFVSEPSGRCEWSRLKLAPPAGAPPPLRLLHCKLRN